MEESVDKIAGNLTGLDLDATICYTRRTGEEVTMKKVSLITHKRKGTIVRAVTGRDHQLKHTQMVRVFPAFKG